ncbi:LLM class oxidoreductase [Novosphingobium kaempferiae]|uniref:LLM class oxidoreductase n=1 Tax=Novosphingobium kaempferiae TaxID=2896849 RepID=UPI001E30141E|nr:LLM class oxidoreductase [Novosphingobium kaempferiae]
MRELSALAQLVRPGGMTIGLELPLDNEWSPEGEERRLADGRPRGVPDLTRHAAFARKADRLGFAALWLRDVPVFDSVRMGDAGSVFDVFSYLGFLAGITQDIVLGTAAVILPIRHPLMTAKAAATVDVLSGGRLVLGVASGDRPIEYPLFGVDFDQRGAIFREAVQYIRGAWEPGGLPLGDGDREPTLDILPRPFQPRIPMIVAGRAQQEERWIASHMDGRIVYPGPLERLAREAADWQREGPPGGAFLTPFHLDLAEDPDEEARPIRFGARLGRNALIEHLAALARAGVHHVAINVRQSRRGVSEVLDELAQYVLPIFESERSAA